MSVRQFTLRVMPPDSHPPPHYPVRPRPHGILTQAAPASHTAHISRTAPEMREFATPAQAYSPRMDGWPCKGDDQRVRPKPSQGLTGERPRCPASADYYKLCMNWVRPDAINTTRLPPAPVTTDVKAVGTINTLLVVGNFLEMDGGPEVVSWRNPV